MQTLQNGDLDAIRQLPRILDLGDGSDARVLAFHSRNEQHETIALARSGDGGSGLLALDRDGDDHARQDYRVVERQQRDKFSFQFRHCFHFSLVFSSGTTCETLGLCPKRPLPNDTPTPAGQERLGVLLEPLPDPASDRMASSILAATTSGGWLPSISLSFRSLL